MACICIIQTIADLASALKAKRFQRQIQQDRLAAVIGLSRYTVTDVENASGDPKLSTIIKMAEALGYRLALVPNEARQYVDDFVAPVGFQIPTKSLEGSDDFDLGNAWQGERL